MNRYIKTGLFMAFLVIAMAFTVTQLLASRAASTCTKAKKVLQIKIVANGQHRQPNENDAINKDTSTGHLLVRGYTLVSQDVFLIFEFLYKEIKCHSPERHFNFHRVYLKTLFGNIIASKAP